MKEILDDIDRWQSAGKRVAIARVVDIEGSGPRDPGAAMGVARTARSPARCPAVRRGAVVTEALAVLSEGSPGRMVTFGYSDDEAFAGRADLRRHDPLVHRAAHLVSTVTLRPCATGSGPRRRRPGHRDRGSERRGEAARRARPRTARHARPPRPRPCRGPRRARRAGPAALVRRYGVEGQANPDDPAIAEVQVFVESFAPPPQMWIFGAVDFTAALAKVAKVLGYRVVVCDARRVFATAPVPDGRRSSRLVARTSLRRAGQDARASRRGLRPHPRPEVRRPGHRSALGTNVGYIGVMGSRRTHERRLDDWPRSASWTRPTWPG